MFSTLDEQIDATVGGTLRPAQKLIRYLIVGVVAIIVFGGVFMGVWFLEY
jgi:hypothetical protein